MNRLWLAALGGGFCLLAVELVNPPTFHLRVEHFQGSAARVDLVVMREIGKAFEDTEQQRNRWFAHSPLEGDGFEPSVPVVESRPLRLPVCPNRGRKEIEFNPE